MRCPLKQPTAAEGTQAETARLAPCATAQILKPCRSTARGSRTKLHEPSAVRKATTEGRTEVTECCVSTSWMHRTRIRRLPRKILKPSIQSRLEQLTDRFDSRALLHIPSVIPAGSSGPPGSSPRLSPVQCSSLAALARRHRGGPGAGERWRRRYAGNAEEELQLAQQKSEELDEELQRLMLPKDPNDGKNVFLEIGPAPAVTKPPYLPATCSDICAAPSAGAGRSKF